MPTKRDLRETADGLARILAAVKRGELDAPPGLVARLDGARLALETLAEPEPKRAENTTPRSS